MLSRPTIATVILGSLIVAASPIPSVTAEQPDRHALEASQLRAELGLEASISFVSNLVGSSADVGSSAWGIPMTRDESASVNLAGRMAFADHVDTVVLSRLKELPIYAGSYYEPDKNGRLTIMVTSLDDATRDEIGGWMGPTQWEWGIGVGRHSMKRLMDAVADIHTRWDGVGAGIPLMGAGVDVQTNSLFVEVDSTNARGAESAAERLSSELGISVATRVGTPGTDTHCTTNRDHCDGPMKAGINIYKGANFSINTCTMGFHIRRNFDGDKQFVTAGHCGYSGSNSWFHPAFTSAIGAEPTGGSLYRDGGYDVMRVTMLDSQASDDVYGESNNIVGHGSPTTGETLCASLGTGSETVKCGTVQDNWRSWISETAGFQVYGGDMSYSTIKGDSGSPVYRRLPGGTGDDIRAIGVNDHENGYFAHISLALTSFDSTVVQ